jgi:hypothetical protein
MLFRNFFSELVRSFEAPMNFFVLVGSARSGTGFLRGIVNNHPNATCAGELLHPSDNKLREQLHNKFLVYDGQWLDFQGDARQWKKQAIAYLGNKLLPRGFAGNPFGFKVLYYQLELLDLYDYFGRGNFKTLHIVRNPIAVYVSLEQAKITQKWTAETEKEKVGADPVKINPQVLAGFIADYIKQRDKVNMLSTDLLQVEYSTLVRKTQETMKQVFEFLKVPYMETIPSLIKQQPWDVHNRIYNFEEVSQSLPEQYTHFLSELL